MIFIFISIVSVVLALIHFVVYKFLVTIFLFPLAGRLALGIIIAILGLSFIISSVLSFNFYNSFSKIYYTISASWLGFVTYLFLASFVYGFVILVARYFDPNIKLGWFGILCTCIAVLVSIYGLVHARNMTVKTVEINLPNIPNNWLGKKIVWISDIHLGAVHGKSFAREIVNKINEVNPDAVFIGGDLYDGVKVDEVDIIQPFKDLHPILGTYFITGNHEEFRDNSTYLNAVREIGIKVLNNEMVDLMGIQLIGVDDRDSIKPNKLKEIISGLNLDKNKPSILLKHQPSQLDIAENAGISLQISGHTHRAQIFPLNIFTYLIFKGYDHGLKYFGKMAEYTSTGVGTWGPPMRVGSDSEIIVFKFK